MNHQQFPVESKPFYPDEEKQFPASQPIYPTSQLLVVPQQHETNFSQNQPHTHQQNNVYLSPSYFGQPKRTQRKKETNVNPGHIEPEPYPLYTSARQLKLREKVVNGPRKYNYPFEEDLNAWEPQIDFNQIIHGGVDGVQEDFSANLQIPEDFTEDTQSYTKMVQFEEYNEQLTHQMLIDTPQHPYLGDTGYESSNDGNSIDKFIKNDYQCEKLNDSDYLSDRSLKDFLKQLSKESVDEEQLDIVNKELNIHGYFQGESISNATTLHRTPKAAAKRFKSNFQQPFKANKRPIKNLQGQNAETVLKYMIKLDRTSDQMEKLSLLPIMSKKRSVSSSEVKQQTK